MSAEDCLLARPIERLLWRKLILKLGEANCGGIIPVAIFGSDTLDVIQIDQTTLSFEGEGVRVRGNGVLSCGIRDANSDGYDDLVCRYDDSTTEGTLTGELLDGTPIEGADTFCLGN